LFLLLFPLLSLQYPDAPNYAFNIWQGCVSFYQSFPVLPLCTYQLTSSFFYSEPSYAQLVR
jgi:hypothetical protein